MGFALEPLPQSRPLAGRPKDAPRDVLIVAIAINHPDLLARHAEEIAALELSSAGLAAFRDRLLNVAIDLSEETLADGLAAAGLGAERDRLLTLAVRLPDWPRIRPEASQGDVEQVLRQTLALHRKTRALNKELKLAEKALAEDFNEQNFARLRDIRETLASLTGAEAVVEEHGDHSDPQGQLI
jgi:DNA primase